MIDRSATYTSLPHAETAGIAASSARWGGQDPSRKTKVVRRLGLLPGRVGQVVPARPIGGVTMRDGEGRRERTPTHRYAATDLLLDLIHGDRDRGDLHAACSRLGVRHCR